MKYAVELFFDDDNETYVKGIWEGLKVRGISSNMADIHEMRPHITLAVYNSELPIDQYLQTFDKATKKISSFEVKFESLSIFPPSGDFSTSVVFAPPTNTIQLLELHNRFYLDFDEYNSYANALYIPGRWTPHCTYAIGLDDDALSKAIEYCLEQFRPKQCTITEIAVVKIEMSEEVSSSKTIYSKQLS